ncbi:MAG: pilus assembly protein PilB [Nostocaceae cyanobacterium]|nr:pilus assembly protein PilB [Nostocaceae cyanobacterium]
MLSSQGTPAVGSGGVKSALSANSTDWQQSLDCEHLFHLIKTILPFEACLHYQILPLELEDKKLVLGMVDLEDSGAMDYVSRIVSYLNCTIEKKAITSQTHQSLLSAYLKQDNESQNVAAQTPQLHSTASTESQPILESIESPVDNQQSTHIESSTQNQEARFSLEQTEISPDFPSTPESDSTSFSITPESPTTTPLVEETSKTISQDATTTVFAWREDTSHLVDIPEDIPVLPVASPELFTPTEMLTTLPPKKLLTELLGRVLTMGIGRLYLERQPYQGRILWSDNGIVQSVLETVPLSVYQGVLNELKRFLSLPLTRVAETKQVEKEYLYQQQRLLLRLRIMPGKHGEEATLQVLRGTALKFYQKQQLTRLSQDTLRISQQLSYKLHELQERAFRNGSFNPQQLEAFNCLNQLVENLDHQIDILTKPSQEQ